MLYDNQIGGSTYSIGYYNIKVQERTYQGDRAQTGTIYDYHIQINFVLQDGRTGFFMQTRKHADVNPFFLHGCYVVELEKYNHNDSISRFCDDPDVIKVHDYGVSHDY